MFSEVLKGNVRVRFEVLNEGKENSAPEEVLSDVIGKDFLEIIDE